MNGGQFRFTFRNACPCRFWVTDVDRPSYFFIYNISFIYISSAQFSKYNNTTTHRNYKTSGLAGTVVLDLFLSVLALFYCETDADEI